MAEENEAVEAESWYELSFSRALTEPALIAGVPKSVLVWNGLFAVLLIINFGFWQVLIFTVAMHFLAIYLCKGDQQFFSCLQSYINKKNYYTT